MTLDKERMQLRISKANKERLDEIAQEYGMSSNSLVSFIIGEWLQDRERTEEMIKVRFYDKENELIKQNETN